MNGMARMGLWLAALSLAAVGCTPSSSANNSGGSNAGGSVSPDLPALASPMVPDVPVPAGFKWDQGKSQNSATPGVRVISHIYKGSAEKFAVASFYRKQMPVSGWVLRADNFDQKIVTLEFEKEAESCRVILSDSGLFGGTEVLVRLYPNGGGPRK
jgi:hypothetical protein